MEKVGIPRTTIRLNVAGQLLADDGASFCGRELFCLQPLRPDGLLPLAKFVLSDQTKRILREIKKP